MGFIKRNASEFKNIDRGRRKKRNPDFIEEFLLLILHVLDGLTCAGVFAIDSICPLVEKARFTVKFYKPNLVLRFFNVTEQNEN